MSVSLRLSRLVRVGIKVENQFRLLNKTKNVNLPKLDANGIACFSAGNRRLYSVEAQPLENKTIEVPVSASIEVKKNGEKVTHADRIAANKAIANEQLSFLNELKKLDEQVKLVGRVDKNQIFTLLRKCNEGMSHIEAVMLIRCCGSLLVKETLEVRKEVLEKSWSKVEKCCPSITTEIVNALYGIKIENGVKFEPAEVLIKLQEINSTPNKATFNLMMSQYCEVGDVTGAMEVLNHMKLMDVPVSLSSMHHLIKGYCKRGNFVEANKLIETMGQNDLRPISDTYIALMMGHAENGDLEEIKKVMAVMAGKNMKISLGGAYDIVLKLALSGHKEKVEEALSVLISNRIYDYNSGHKSRINLNNQRKFEYQDSLNLIYQLVAYGHFDVIVLAIKKMVSSSVIYENLAPRVSNNIIILELIRKSFPVKELLSVKDMLVKEGLMTEDVENIAYLTLKHQQTDYIIEMLTELKELGLVIKSHFFWPVLNAANDKKNINDIYKISKAITNSSIQLENSAVTLLNWSYDNLIKLGQTHEQILEKYKEQGVPESVRDNITITNHLRRGTFAKVQELVENGHHFSPLLLKSFIKEGFRNSNLDMGGFLQMVKNVGEKVRYKQKFNGDMMLGAVKSLDKSEDVNKFLQMWIEEGLKFESRSPVLKEAIRRRANKELLEKVSALSTSEYSTLEFDSPLLKDITITSSVDAVAPKVEKKKVQKVMDSEIIREAKKLLWKKDDKGFRKFVYDLAQKGDMEGLLSLQKLRLNRELALALDRTIFVANIDSGKGAEFVTSKGEEILRFISVNLLTKLAEKDPEAFAQVEEIMMKPVEDMKLISAYASLYIYSLKKNNADKCKQLLEVHPILKEKIVMKNLCHQARLEKNETLLTNVINLHKNCETPFKIAAAYNNLVILKCEAHDWKSALDYYNEAVSNNVTFASFSVRALHSLQSTLQANQQPLPWKEGDVEKKAEEASKKREESNEGEVMSTDQ